MAGKNRKEQKEENNSSHEKNFETEVTKTVNAEKKIIFSVLLKDFKIVGLKPKSPSLNLNR